jgi:hypothetical protein
MEFAPEKVTIPIAASSGQAGKYSQFLPVEYPNLLGLPP